jgi:hypothetical protein
MILICQPKSGSTSLIDTLNRCGFNTVEVCAIENKKPEEFIEIQKYHNNTDLRIPETLKDLISSSIIYREHLLPCENHFNVIESENKPCVVLLRNPFHSFDSYKRYFEVYGKTVSEDLLKDLTLFNLRWRRFCKDKNYMLIVDYKNLVLNFKKTFAEIINHLGLKIEQECDNIVLSKRLYTGIGEGRFKNGAD